VREVPVIVAITKYPIVLRDSWVGQDRPQRRSIFGMVTTIVALHVVGWAAVFFLVVPGGYLVQGTVFGVGLGVTITWVTAIAVWRIGDVEHRWQRDLIREPQG
jgi:hypothetical protein